MFCRAVSSLLTPAYSKGRTPTLRKPEKEPAQCLCMQQHNVDRLTRAGTVSSWLTRTSNLTSIGRYFLQRALRTTFQLGEIGASWDYKSQFFFAAGRAHNNQSLLTEAEINREENRVRDWDRMTHPETEIGTDQDTPGQRQGLGLAERLKQNRNRDWDRLRCAGTGTETG